MSEQNKELVKSFFDEVLNQGRTDRIADYVTGDYELHISGQPTSLDVVGHGYMVQQLRSGFPDWSEEVVAQFAEGDRVISHVRGRGTHRDTYMGIPATGREVTIDSINIDQLNDGKITQRWLLADMYAGLVQLGVIPGPGATA